MKEHHKSKPSTGPKHRYSGRMFFACIAALLLFATSGAYAQEQTYNLRLTNVSLEQAFNQIEKISSYRVMYSPQAVNVNQRVSVNLVNKTIAEMMDAVLAGKGISYQINGQQIVLLPQPNATLAEQQPAQNARSGNTPEASSPQNAGTAGQAQKNMLALTGIVTDAETKEPVPFATIIVKNTLGTVVGTTTTNDNGRYTIGHPNSSDILHVSFIGYVTQEIPLQGRTSLDITLQPDTQQLAEVVVTGYQTISKERATGAYAIVGSQALEQKITFNATSALEGQVAGLTTYGGDIVIRGRSTISDNVSTNPLLVIDNLPTEMSLDDININDIATMTVLKDAAATSIYGSRAANGVIVITTKKGDQGKTTVSFSSDWRWETNPSFEDYRYAPTSYYIDATEKAWQRGAQSSAYAGNVDAFILNEYNRGRGGSVYYTSPHAALRLQLTQGSITQAQYNEQVNKLKTYDYRKEYMKELWRTPFRQSYNLSVSNASERQNTYASFNLTRNAMQMTTNNSQSMKGYIKTSQNITKWMSLEIGMDALYGTQESVNSSLNLSFAGQMSYLEPYTRIYNENGELDYKPYPNSSITSTFFGTGLGVYYSPKLVSEMQGIKGYRPMDYNIMEEVARNTVNTKSLNLRSFAQLNINIYKGLKFSSSFSYEVKNTNNEIYYASDSYALRGLNNRLLSGTITNPVSNIPEGGRLDQNITSGHNYTFRNQLDYHVNIKDAHTITALAGIELRETETDKNVATVLWGYDPQVLSMVTPATFNFYNMINSGVTSLMYNTNQRMNFSNTVPSPLALGTNPLNRFVSLYGNVSYGYKNLYNLTGSVRVDQTNLFGTDPKYRYRPLWSIGASWNISNEGFMESSRSWLDMFTAKASYGVTGNVDPTSSPYILITLGTNSFPGIDPINYSSLSGTPNPLLRWEKTSSYSLEFDFSVLKGLLSGSIGGYYKYSDDLIANISLPESSGYTTARVNNGAMSNRGLELVLHSPWFRKNGWKLESSLVFGYNKNRMERTDRKPTSAGQLTNGKNWKSYYMEGNPFAALYAYRYAGIETHGSNAQNGIPIIVDQNGERLWTISETGAYASKYTTTPPSAVQYMGSLEPLFNGSFTQRVSYKGFELMAMLTYYGGHKMRKPSYNYYSVNGEPISGMGTISIDVLDAWSPDNPNSSIPKPQVDYPYGGIASAAYTTEPWRYSDAHVVNADILRFKNLALSYSLDSKRLKTLRLQRVKLTAQVNDLCFWSAAGKNIDSEVYTGANLNAIDWIVPTQPSYLLRLEIVF